MKWFWIYKFTWKANLNKKSEKLWKTLKVYIKANKKNINLLQKVDLVEKVENCNWKNIKILKTYVKMDKKI